MQKLVCFTLGLVLFEACASTPQQNIDPPNIVVIICDDLGYADVGFNGSTDITTPAIDELATGGTVFSSAYVAHPFCGPSRAGLLTGRYPHSFGSQFNIPANSEDQGYGIPLSEKFLSEELQEAGYYTGIVGKWHLGANAQFHPNERGFNDFYGFLGGGHDYFPEKYQAAYKRQKEAGVKKIFDYLKPLERNGVDQRETEYITDALSREAARFVADASKKDKPFFLYLAYNAPHSPLQAKEEDLAKFSHIQDKKRKTYAAMVYAVDRGVQRLVDQLKASGEYENTLIVFLSDNGGKLKLGANNYPLKRGKGSTSEGGYRVPMFFHWPNQVKSGVTYSHPVSALDFYPTFVHLAQSTIAKDEPLDGKNIWEGITTNTSARPGEMIYVMRHWPGYSDVGARMDDWKILKQDEEPWKLYNVQTDLSENIDLTAGNKERLKTMVERAELWSQTHAEPLWFDPESLREDWSEKEMAEFHGVFEID
ncbi:sulfatase-like hydrolase/transferase [Reichenbachiella sp.]|uniref:sulfatase-like hydrolase/transferase n=1 Tax=Reichenbachiella sp. TaxID=2184521 RepID=UPI003BAFCA8D